MLTRSNGDTSPRKMDRTDSFRESCVAAIQTSCSPTGRYIHMRNMKTRECIGTNTFANDISSSAPFFDRLF